MTYNGGAADSNGDDNMAIVICGSGCATWTVLDIYGVIGQQGSTTNNHFFQYGHAERIPGRLTAKSSWAASDWNSLYGLSLTSGGYVATDMTPRKWGTATASPTSKPSSKPSPKPTRKPTAKPIVNPTSIPTSVNFKKPTVYPTAVVVKTTAWPSISPSTRPSARPTPRRTSNPTALFTVKPSARPTLMPTVLPFNLIITELTDPLDKSGARYIELYSNNGAGRTIINPYLYLIRWTNGNAGKFIYSFLILCRMCAVQ